MKCKNCNLEMNDSDGCTVTTIKINGRQFDRVPYFNPSVEPGDRSAKRCHDCNVLWGRIHHTDCDFERCPNCGNQLISCVNDITELLTGRKGGCQIEETEH